MRIIRPKELREKLGISHATLWRWSRAEGFPAKVQLGANAVGWIEEEIEAWILRQQVGRQEIPLDQDPQ